MIGQAKRLYELNSLVSTKTESNSECKIITFASGKGGTGKSFISSNMAYELSKNGNNVLLIDLDVNLGNQGAIFNLSSQKTLYHFLTYNYNIEDIIRKYSENLHIVLSESGKLDHPILTEDKINLLINELKTLTGLYDFIIIDSASGIENGTIHALLNSDEAVIVTTPEPTSVMDAYVVFKFLKSHGSRAINNVIVNKCLDSKDGEETFNNLQIATDHFLKTKLNLLGELSYSLEVVKSIRDQKLLVQSEKPSKIATQINLLSNKLKITTTG